MAANKSSNKFYEALLKDVRAALAKHPGDLTHDDVNNAAVDALLDQPLQAIFGAIRDVADEPDMVRVLCDTAQTKVDFCSEDLESIATALGYRPVPGAVPSLAFRRGA